MAPPKWRFPYLSEQEAYFLSFLSALIQRNGGTRRAKTITRAIPRISNNISLIEPSRVGMKDWRYSSTAATAMASKAAKE